MAPRQKSQHHLPLRQRFESFFTKPSDPNGCWEWQGTRSKKGYGQFRVDRRMLKAHRVSYELYCGEITDDLHVLHACDNKCCVNPSHFELGTNEQNVGDAWARGRRKSKLSAEAIADILSSELPQAELAVKYGVKQPYISRLKAGIRGVRRTEQEAVRRALPRP